MMKKLICFITILLLFFSCEGDSQASKTDLTMTREENESKGPEIIEAFGIVAALNVKNIFIDFSARVEKIHAREGMRLIKGAPLITLDLGVVTNEINRLKSSLAVNHLKLRQIENESLSTSKEIERRYQSLKNNIRVAEEELEAKRAELAEKDDLLDSGNDPEVKKLEYKLADGRLELKTAMEDLEDKKELYKQGAAAEQEVTAYERTVRDVFGSQENLKLSLESLLAQKKRELSALVLEIDQKQAALENSRIELKNIESPALLAVEIQKQQVKILEEDLRFLKKKLEKSFIRGNKIVSDLDRAVLETVRCREGDLLGAGSELLSLMDESSLIVDAGIPEEFVKDLRVGNKVKIAPLADKTREYEGEITQIARAAVFRNNETVVPVYISFEDSEGFLLPNFNVDVSIFVENEKKTDAEESSSGAPEE